MADEIDITGVDKAELLAALYNKTYPQGLGLIQATPGDMTKIEAAVILDRGDTYFDYLHGRVMKVDLSGDTLDPWGFDRDNYDGAVADVVASLS